MPSHARASRSPRRSPGFYRPRVEPLEDRCLLAAQFFRVPGAVGVSQTLRFNWAFREAAFDNEIGVYVADDASGKVDGVSPGDPGYLKAVLKSSTRQVVFDSSTGAGNFRTLSFTGGQRLGFYLIENTTSSTLLKLNPTNRSGHGPVAFFSFSDANPDGLDHTQVRDLGNTTRFAWEDLVGLGDADFNDVVFDVHRTGPGEVNSNFEGRAIATPGSPGQLVSAVFSLNRRDPNFRGEVGLFQVDDASGRIGNLKPGDPGYEAAALDRARRTVLFDLGEKAGSTANVDLPGGSFFGVYVIKNGTADMALAGQAKPLFSFLDANPGDRDLMRQYFNSTFGFEAGADGKQDFNDVMVHFHFETRRQTLTARLQNDTGASNTDGITSDPTVVGQLGSPSSLRSLRAGFDGTASTAFRDVTGAVRADGSFTLDLNLLNLIFGSTLPEGNRVLHLEATDVAGNVSRFDLAFTFDRTPPPLALSLTTDTDPDNDLVTQFDTVTLRATTTPGLVVRLEQLNRTAVADGGGHADFTGVPLTSGANDFTMTVTDTAGNTFTTKKTITRNDAPTNPNAIGTQNLTVGGSNFSVDLDNVFADANIVNSIARFDTNFGQFDVELFDASTNGATPVSAGSARTTPGHVANFLRYVDQHLYDNTIIHRAPPNFVVQGGAFKVANGAQPASVSNLGTIASEAGNSNVRGTISLARSNTATSAQSGSNSFFISVVNNNASGLTNLDADRGGFTAFGTVLGSGMSVVDAMAGVQTFNVGNPSEALPLQNYAGPVSGYPTNATAANYVVINSVTVWQRKDVLTYSDVSASQNVVLVAIDSATGQLTLTPQNVGTATIIIRATDSHGGFVDNTFTVNVRV